MDGAHDMGGVAWSGPVVPEPDEPMFHAEWERRAFAITLAMGMPGGWNIDMSRFARENRPPEDYLSKSYFQIWLAGLETLMVERGLVTREEIEARFARKHLDSEELGVSYFRYGPGFRSPMGHRHRVQEEAYVVVSGSGRIRLGDEIHELRQWDVVRVSPETVRAFEAGADGLEVIAIGSDRPEGGDGVRAETAWVE